MSSTEQDAKLSMTKLYSIYCGEIESLWRYCNEWETERLAIGMNSIKDAPKTQENGNRKHSTQLMVGTSSQNAMIITATMSAPAAVTKASHHAPDRVISSRPDVSKEGVSLSKTDTQSPLGRTREEERQNLVP